MLASRRREGMPGEILTGEIWTGARARAAPPARFIRDYLDSPSSWPKAVAHSAVEAQDVRDGTAADTANLVNHRIFIRHSLIENSL